MEAHLMDSLTKIDSGNKLTSFPPLLSDELLYSVFARYHLWERNCPKETISELFGNSSAHAVVGMPGRLRNFGNRLPDGVITPEEIIEKHTFYPAYRPFLTVDHAEKIKNLMIDGDGNQIASSLGRQTGFTAPKYLRYCPICFRNDQYNHGEAYWHRVHQLQGVLYCPEHEVLLENSIVAIAGRTNRREFVPLSTKVFGANETKLEGNESHYINIAKMYNWLLQNKLPSISTVELSQRHKHGLIHKDLITYLGNVRLNELISQFESFYSVNFLKDLECSINSNPPENSWVARLLNSSKQQHAILRHILMIIFSGNSIEDFFTKSLEYHPFGAGPWKCLNPFCKDYQRNVISDCSVTKHTHSLKPLGKFECHCGFTYTRIGPDAEMEKQEEVSQIKSYGAVWTQGVRDLHSDGKNIEQIVEFVKLSRTPVRAALGLNKEVSKKKSTSPKIAPNFYDRLTRLLKANPGITRSQLQSLDAAAYQTIRKRDPKWFEINMPVTKKGERPLKRDKVDWQERDAIVAEDIKQAVSHILNADKPERITLAAITRKCKISSFVLRDKRLKRCHEILSKVLESDENFIHRRLKFYLAKSLDEFDYINKPYILKSCNFHNPYSPQIQEVWSAIYEAAVAKEEQVNE